MATARQIGLLNDREWEAGQLARERRQKALEDARDEREDEKEDGDMDDAAERGNGQYMLAAVGELELNAIPTDQFTFGFLADDLDIFPDDAFQYTDATMEEILEVIDGMEEEQRLDTLEHILAALPKAKATRKSTRKGASKRKVQFGEVDRTRWPQAAAFRPNPLHAAVATSAIPSALVPAQTVQRLVIKSKIHKKEMT